MKYIKIILLLITTLSFAQVRQSDNFYGAGAYVTGGNGNPVYIVTNLNDSGAGSFRDAIGTANRVVVFNVSGEITLTSGTLFVADNVTIAGFTAPEGGIRLRGNRMYASGSDNIIIQGIQFYNGNESNNGDNLTIASNYGLMVDHCSFAWSKDEAIDLESSYNNDGNQTIQNCLFVENKTAMLVGTDNISVDAYGEISILRNVTYNSKWRFPKTNGSVLLDVINNFHYNWQYRTLRLDASISTENFELNHINNYYHSGYHTAASAGSTGAGIFKISTGDGTSNPKIWSSGNHLDNDILQYYGIDGTYHATLDSDESMAWSNFPSTATQPVQSGWFQSSQMALKGYAPTILDDSVLESTLLADVGASKYFNPNGDGTLLTYRSVLDTNAISKIQSNSQDSYIQTADPEWADSGTVTSNTRPASYDTDNDGMPDVWETAQFGDLTRDGTGDYDSDGVSDLHEFIFGGEISNNDTNTFNVISIRKKIISKRSIKRKLIKI